MANNCWVRLDGLVQDPPCACTGFAVTVVVPGTTGATPFPIPVAHNLNTTDVIVQTWIIGNSPPVNPHSSPTIELSPMQVTIGNENNIVLTTMKSGTYRILVLPVKGGH